MKTNEYYVKRLSPTLCSVTKFPEGSTTPESSYEVEDVRSARICQCKGFQNRGKCRHQPMIDEFIERGEPVPCVIVKEE